MMQIMRGCVHPSVAVTRKQAFANIFSKLLESTFQKAKSKFQ